MKEVKAKRQRKLFMCLYVCPSISLCPAVSVSQSPSVSLYPLSSLCLRLISSLSLSLCVCVCVCVCVWSVSLLVCLVSTIHTQNSDHFLNKIIFFCTRTQLIFRGFPCVFQIDSFFARLPHRFKVFVGGNHDSCLDGLSVQQVQQHLSSCVYLCETSVHFAGLNFYGSPYTASR